MVAAKKPAKAKPAAEPKTPSKNASGHYIMPPSESEPLPNDIDKADQQINDVIAKVGDEGHRLAVSVVDRAKEAGVSINDLYFDYLNPQQNIFIREYLSNGRDGLKAYRTAYVNSMNDTAARVEAHRKLESPGIRMALSSIERQCQARLALTLESHLQRLADLSKDAQRHKQFSAAITAEVSRGKAAGLYVTKHEVTGKDGAPLGLPTPEQMAKLSLDELQALNNIMMKIQGGATVKTDTK